MNSKIADETRIALCSLTFRQCKKHRLVETINLHHQLRLTGCVLRFFSNLLKKTLPWSIWGLNMSPVTAPAKSTVFYFLPFSSKSKRLLPLLIALVRTSVSSINWEFSSNCSKVTSKLRKGIPLIVSRKNTSAGDTSEQHIKEIRSLTTRNEYLIPLRKRQSSRGYTSILFHDSIQVQARLDQTILSHFCLECLSTHKTKWSQ